MSSKTLAAFLMLFAAAPHAVYAAEASKTPPAASGEVVYPDPPDKPRIRFVRSILNMRDLKGGKVGLAGKFLAFLAGGELDHAFVDRPYGIWKQGSNLYLTDTGAQRLVVLNLAKASVRYIGETGEGRLMSPVGVTVDDSGAVYVTDTGDQTVKAYSGTGKFLWKSDGMGGESGKLNRPGAVALTPSGELLVLDNGNHRLVLLSKEGTFIREMCRNGKDVLALPNPGSVGWKKTEASSSAIR